MKKRSLILVVGLMLLPVFILSAQNTSEAVMQVQATVIPGSQVEGYINYDISDQLNDPDLTLTSLEFGDYILTVPDGAIITGRVERNIQMNSGEEEFLIEAVAERFVTEEGKIVYSLSGLTDGRKIEPGIYRGEQFTTIEYH